MKKINYQAEIEHLKNQIVQCDTAYPKLLAQNTKLKQDYEELSELVDRKLEEHQRRQKERVKRAKPIEMSEEEIVKRVEELEHEYVAVVRHGNTLREDLRRESLNVRSLSDAKELERQVKVLDSKMMEELGEIKRLEKRNAELVKAIDTFEQRKDSVSAQLNRSNKEVISLNDKIKGLERSIDNEKVKMVKQEAMMETMDQKYRENAEKCGMEVKEINYDYQNMLRDNKKKRAQSVSVDGKLRDKRASSVKQKTVKELINDKDYAIEGSAENQKRLEQNIDKIKHVVAHSELKNDKDVKILENQITDLRFQIETIQMKTREKEKEIELAKKKYDLEKEQKTERKQHLIHD